jgi:hypothetical protein
MSCAQVNSTSKLKRAEGDGMADAADALERRRLGDFIAAAQTALEVVRRLNTLGETLGHFAYRRAELVVPVRGAPIGELCEEVRAEEGRWRAALGELRRRHYYLNFFFSKQLWELADFALGAHPPDSPPTRAQLDLLRFACPDLDEETLLRDWHGVADSDGVGEAKGDMQVQRRDIGYLRQAGADPVLRLEALAGLIDEMVGGLVGAEPEPHRGHGEAPARAPVAPKAALEAEGLLVSTYRGEAELYATVFALYDHFQEARSLRRSHLLICEAGTSHEEMLAFVHRAFSPAHATRGLFCVLNVHTLSHERRSFLSHAAIQARHARHPLATALLGFLVPAAQKLCLDELKFPTTTVAPLELGRLQALVQVGARAG